MKNSSDTIGNRTRNLPTCSTVPQPTAPPRAPTSYVSYFKCPQHEELHQYNNTTIKGKAHPLQAMQAQRGLGELRLLDFLTSALYGGRLSASYIQGVIKCSMKTIQSMYV
jgi:hypothetical protein